MKAKIVIICIIFHFFDTYSQNALYDDVILNTTYFVGVNSLAESKSPFAEKYGRGNGIDGNVMFSLLLNTNRLLYGLGFGYYTINHSVNNISYSSNQGLVNVNLVGNMKGFEIKIPIEYEIMRIDKNKLVPMLGLTPKIQYMQNTFLYRDIITDQVIENIKDDSSMKGFNLGIAIGLNIKPIKSLERFSFRVKCETDLFRKELFFTRTRVRNIRIGFGLNYIIS